MTWSHIGPCTWWKIEIRGRRLQIGENHGTPFQISTRASYEPIRRVNSEPIVLGNTVWRLPRRITS